MKKIIFICPYFGKYPNYFNLTLNSIKYNDTIDWLIITDIKKIYEYPQNVKIINMTFDELREKGVKAGLLKLRMFRPFPAEEIAEALQGLKAVAILDKADSLNSAGGALFEDVTSAMYVNKKQVPMVNYIYGIGGRDTTTMQIESVYNDLQEIVKTGETGNPYRYLGLRKGEE